MFIFLNLNPRHTPRILLIYKISAFFFFFDILSRQYSHIVYGYPLNSSFFSVGVGSAVKRLRLAMVLYRNLLQFVQLICIFVPCYASIKADFPDDGYAAIQLKANEYYFAASYLFFSIMSLRYLYGSSAILNQSAIL